MQRITLTLSSWISRMDLVPMDRTMNQVPLINTGRGCRQFWVRDLLAVVRAELTNPGRG